MVGRAQAGGNATAHRPGSPPRPERKSLEERFGRTLPSGFIRQGIDFEYLMVFDALEAAKPIGAGGLAAIIHEPEAAPG